MKKLLVFLCAMLLLLGTAEITGAALYEIGVGLIYDDYLEITWLQDANYAQTSGYDTDGQMNWSDAVDWADQLVYGGYDDWRLPTTVGETYEYGYDGTTTTGYNITSSEMGYMYYENLHNLGYLSTGGNTQQGWGLTNTNPFLNLQRGVYWSGTEPLPIQTARGASVSTTAASTAA